MDTFHTDGRLQVEGVGCGMTNAVLPSLPSVGGGVCPGKWTLRRKCSNALSRLMFSTLSG